MAAPEVFAAVDLGSNSFHLLVASEQDGHLHTVDRMREVVRLAAGLDESHRLRPEAEQIALECLSRFGQRLRDMPPGNVRAVGTNTLRRATNAEDFIANAQKALGHSIDVIAGREEARLIYLGVSHSQAFSKERQLVVDIGGGSTEVIIGEGFEPQETESLYMGCVDSTERFFANGEVTAENLRAAEIAASVELRPIRRRYLDLGWACAVGASGTIKAINRIAQDMGWSDGGITLEALEQLRRTLTETGKIGELKLKGLQDERRPVLAGGVAVLYSVFKSLNIKHMEVSSGALREGLIYDVMGRTRHEDVRARTVDVLRKRHDIDYRHAQRVEATCRELLGMVAGGWKLDREGDAEILSWVARVHEIGLTVAHVQYHKHGAYLLAHADLPGFSRHEQSLLAALVRTHRRKISTKLFEAVPVEWRQRAIYLSVLLRLSVLLHRSRDDIVLPVAEIKANEDSLSLKFPEAWLERHPLTLAELEQEKNYLKAVDIKLKIA